MNKSTLLNTNANLSNYNSIIVVPVTSTLTKAADRLKFSLATVLAADLVNSTNQFDNLLQLQWSRPRAMEEANLIALRLGVEPAVVDDDKVIWYDVKTAIGTYKLVQVDNDAHFDYFPFFHFNFVTIGIDYKLNVNKFENDIIKSLKIISNNIKYDTILTVQADCWELAILILVAIKQVNEGAMTVLQANKFIYLLYPNLEQDDSEILTLLEEYVFDQ